MKELAYSRSVLKTLSVAVELLLTPLILNRTSACQDYVSYILYIYISSRTRIVKVLADGLLNVVVIALHKSASHRPEFLRKIHLQS